MKGRRKMIPRRFECKDCGYKFLVDRPEWYEILFLKCPKCRGKLETIAHNRPFEAKDIWKLRGGEK